MANKTTHERASAILNAGPDKATHDAIEGMRQALQADIVAWHERLSVIAVNGNHIGAERRRVLETGTVEDVMKLEIESQQLGIWIERARAQATGLTALDKQVFARESLANLPAQYENLTETLGAIADANRALSEGWAKFEEQASEVQLQRLAVAESGEDVPAPPAALGEALTAGWRGAAPVPMSSMFDKLYRSNIGEMLGLNVVDKWQDGVRFNAAA